MPVEQATIVPRLRPGAPILTDTLFVGGLSVFARIAGAAKTILSARCFGPGDDLDAYLLAFLIPSLLADVLCGALNPALVPILLAGFEAGRRDEALSVYADALYRSVTALTAIAMILVACACSFDPAIVGIHPARLDLTRRMLVIMAPILPMSAMANVWRSVLNAELRFGAAAFTPGLTPLVAIAFLGLASRWGVVVLAWGSVIGMLAELAVLALALRLRRMPVMPKRTHVSTGIRARRQYGALVAGNLVLKSANMVDQTMAALLERGGLSILNFGARLLAVLLSIGPMAVSTTILPRFSRMTAGRQWAQLRRFLITALTITTVVTALVAAVLIRYSEPIVRIAFQHGAFTPADARSVAVVQSCFLLQAPFVMGFIILNSFLAATKSNRLLVRVATAGFGLNAVLDYVLMKRFGVPGIALASSIAQAFMFAAMAFLVFRAVPVSQHRQSAVGCE